MRGDHNIHPPLEPFLDFMAVLIMTLAATSGWAQIATMPLDQPIAPGCIGVPPPCDDCLNIPPLTVHVRADGVWAGRNPRTGTCPVAGPLAWWACNWPGSSTDVEGLRAALTLDRGWLPEETQIVIVTDDGIEYGRMIEVLDLARGLGYATVMLGGGPPWPSMPLP